MGLAGGFADYGGAGAGGGFGTDDVDAAFEVGAVVDADAGRFDVADQTALFADRDLLGDFDVAFDGAEDGDLPGLDVRLHFAVGADGDRAERFEEAFHFTIHH